MKSTSISTQTLLAYTALMLWTRKEPKRTDHQLNTQLRKGIKNTRQRQPRWSMIHMMVHVGFSSITISQRQP